MFACHPERSEGSGVLAHDSLTAQILRFAQNDMRAGHVTNNDERWWLFNIIIGGASEKANKSAPTGARESESGMSDEG